MGSSSNVIEVNDLNFAQEVLQTDTPVLVDFSASWCAPCKRLAPIVDEIAAETAGQVKVVKLDVDESPAAAQRFGIRGLPTVVAFQKGEPSSGATSASRTRRRCSRSSDVEHVERAEHLARIEASAGDRPRGDAPHHPSTPPDEDVTTARARTA